LSTDVLAIEANNANANTQSSGAAQRALTASPNTQKLEETQRQFSERLKTAYVKSSMRRRAKTTMGFGSSFFL